MAKKVVATLKTGVGKKPGPKVCNPAEAKSELAAVQRCAASTYRGKLLLFRIQKHGGSWPG